MAQEAPLRSKIPTKSPQPARSAARAAGWAGPGRAARRSIFTGGTARAATRGGRPVIELECGITVYPAREEQGRWRAVWHENGKRQQCEAASEEKLAARLAKVAERLEADAANMTLRGADLIAFYLSADRLPVQRQWSRKVRRRGHRRGPLPGHHDQAHAADRQRPAHPGEGDRVQGMISALVTAGLEGGYLASERLAKVHWQAGDRALPPPRCRPPSRQDSTICRAIIGHTDRRSRRPGFDMVAASRTLARGRQPRQHRAEPPDQEAIVRPPRRWRRGSHSVVAVAETVRLGMGMAGSSCA